MLHLKLIFISFQYLIFFASADYNQDKLDNGKEMVISRFDSQCRDKNVPMQGFYRGIKSNYRSIFITNTTLIVKEDNLEGLQLTITIERCRSRENLDSCEEHQKRKNVDYCQEINPDSLISIKSPVAFPFQPKLKCPIKKGIYHAYNYTFDLTPFIVSNIGDWYWKGTAEIFSSPKKRLLYCLHVEGFLAPIRQPY